MSIRLFSKTFLALLLFTPLPAFAATTTISQSVANTTEPYLDASKSPDGGTASTALGFRVNGTEMMRVTATGSVGIGTTTPARKLTVNGGIMVNDDAVPLSFQESDQTPPVGTWRMPMDGGFLRFDAATQAGWPSGAFITPLALNPNGNIWTSGTLTQNSDIRMKKDVLPIGNALEKIASVRGVTFRWKNTEKDPAEQMGVIAQEIRPLFPQLVSEDKDGILSVNYPGLTAPLIEAVKELKAENDILRARLEKLEARSAP